MFLQRWAHWYTRQTKHIYSHAETFGTALSFVFARTSIIYARQMQLFCLISVSLEGVLPT